MQMGFHKWILLFLIIAVSESSFGQTDTLGNVINYRDKLTVGSFFSVRSYSLNYTPRVDGILQSDLAESWSPNSRRVVGLSLIPGNIGLRISTSLPTSREDLTRYGQSDQFFLNLNLYGRKLLTETFFRYINGFAVTNRPIQDTVNGTQVFPRKNIQMYHSEVNFLYFTNPDRYSYRASYYFNDRQLKPGGSISLQGKAYYYGLRTDSTFLNDEIDSTFFNESNINRLNLYSVGFGVGYSYSYIFKEYFYLDGGLSIGPEVQLHEFRNTLDQYSSNQLKLQMITDMRLSFGYNHENFYTGIIGTFDFWRMNLPRNLLTTNYFDISVHFGIRIDTPKSIKRIKKELRLD